MENHQTLLTKLCRVCGGQRNPTNKVEPLATQLRHCYNIIVQEDDCRKHPRKVCGACRSKVLQYYKQKNSRAKITVVLPVLFDFKAHTDDCEICFKENVSSPQDAQTTAASERSSLEFEQYEAVAGTSGARPPTSEKMPDPHESTRDLSPLPFLEPLLPATPEALSGTSQETQKPSAQLEPGNSRESPPARKKLKLDASTEEPIFPALNSYSVDRCVNKETGNLLTCGLCGGIPCMPLITPCFHVYCSTCITHTLKFSSVCPTCRLEILSDIGQLSELQGVMLKLYSSIDIACEICQTTVNITDMSLHERMCQPTKRTRGKGVSKVPLNTLSLKYLKEQRLKPIFDITQEKVSDFCVTNFEDETDIYFALLINRLRSVGDRRFEQIHSLWKEQTAEKLSPEQCLALRVDMLTSKNQYAKQYEFCKKFPNNPFQSPSAVTAVEQQFMPGNVRYGIYGEEYYDTLHHTPAKVENVSLKSGTIDCIDISADFSENLTEVFSPNVCGCRFPYADCIAKTLSELEPEIEAGLRKCNIAKDKSTLFKVYIKDGCDGMGDVSVYKGKGDRALPNKAFRACFCVFKVTVLLEEDEVVVFEEPAPNSVKSNRPLLEAIADENDNASSLVCIVPFERERLFLKNKIIEVECESGRKRFEIDFYTSMVDEKLDRSTSGLQGSGSKYLCTLCYATNATAKSKLGTFSIERSYKGTYDIANYVLDNPDNLSKAKLDEVAKGVKALPLVLVDPIKKAYDSTHADINMGRFFKNLLAREVAQVTSWALNADIKHLVIDGEARLDHHLKSNIGLNCQLMMAGNYARVLFDPRYKDVILSIIPNVERRAHLASIFDKFYVMRKVYRALKPLQDLPNEVKNFKRNAVEFAELFLEHFAYAEWPNYFHKIVEHTQELIERPDGAGSIGALSSEGSEAGNKIFRHFRKNLSRRDFSLNSLRDVLHLHWLYSSPTLIRMAQVLRTRKTCSLCFNTGHNARSCTNVSVSND